MNNSASLRPVQGPSTVSYWLLYHNFPTDFISSLQWVKANENTNLLIEFLLQSWKQQEDSAMLLASNKQHKEIERNRKAQQDRQNTQKWTAEKNKDQVGLQEARHLQDFIQNHLEYSKRWNSKKEIFLIEQPSSPL